ncbi:MAG: hypothetical protein K6G85_04440 [Eubacterium sp.]|nr:hypothetical protein [Eubacterium sp.]
MSKNSVGAVALDLELNSKNFDAGLGGITSKAKKAGLAIAAAFSVKKLVDFGADCIELGSDLAEVQNVVDVTFPNMTKKIDEFSQNAASQFGLSETMAKRYAGTLGSMAEAFGFTEKEAADMATTLTGLAGDVASFYNIDQDAAYTKLKSVFSGETESLKDLGIVMTQTALDQYALANGFGKTTAKMNEQEKVALRYAFVQEQLKNATGDFARTSDGWANQMRILSLQFDTLKASIGQGLINLFSPVLKVINMLLGKLATLANAFKSFSEMLTGKKSSGGTTELSTASDELGTVSDEASNASDNVDKIGKSAKKSADKIKKSLAGFDKLNVLSDTDSGDGDSTGKGASGGGIKADSVDFGKTADTSSTKFDKFGKVLDKIRNKFINLAGLFKKGFEFGFKSDGLKKIPGYLDSIRQSLKDIFLDPNVQKSVDNWLNSIVENAGKMVGAVASIGTSLAVNLTGGIAKWLDQSKESISSKIAKLFDADAKIATVMGNYYAALADIFTVFESPEAQQITADFLSIFSEAFLGVAVLAAEFEADLRDTIYTPITENAGKIKTALLNTIKPISEVTTSLREVVKSLVDEAISLYENHISPLLQTLKKTFSKTLSVALDAYNKYVAPVLKNISKDIKDLADQKIKPFIKKVSEALGKIIDAIKDLWVFIQPVVNWIVENAIKNMATYLQVLWDSTKSIFSNIITAVGGIVDVISGLIDFVKGVFTGDWKLAWDGIKEITSGFVDFVKGVFGTIKNAITKPFKLAWVTIKNMFSPAKAVFTKVWSGIKSVFTNVGSWFKEKFSSAWSGIKEKFSISNVKSFFSEVVSGIKTAFKTIPDWLKIKFKNAWQGVKDVFTKGGKIFKGIKEGIASVFKSILRHIISGINTVIKMPFNKINSLLNKIRGISVMGKKPFSSLWDENPLPVPQIPMPEALANGAVLKPNSPFLAMVGDQKHGTNVEAPLDTIKQAVREVAAEKGGSSEKITVNVVLEGDAKGVFKVVKTEATKIQKITGKPAFE